MHSSIAALPCAAVSLESLLSGDEAAAGAAAESIRRHSFAVLRADSASDELEPVKAAEAGMRSFFALPHAEKEACATDASEVAEILACVGSSVPAANGRQPPRLLPTCGYKRDAHREQFHLVIGAAGTQAWPASEADLGDRMLEAASRLRIVAVRILHALSAELADRVEAGSAADPSVLDAWLYHDARCEPGNEECGCAKGPHLDPGLLTVKRASAVAALQCRDVATGKWHAVEAACKPNDLLVLANAELAELELAHAAEHLVMTSAERFSLVYELRAPVELTTGWGEADSESDATDDEEEDGEVDQGSGEESWLARQLRLARVS